MTESLLHQFLAAILSAQVFSAIISVVGLGAIAYYGHRLVRLSARENLAIAERKLFLDLIPKRSEWLTRSVQICDEAVKEISEADDTSYYKSVNIVAESVRQSYKLAEEAEWLFGSDVFDQQLAIHNATLQLMNMRRRIGKDAIFDDSLRDTANQIRRKQVNLQQSIADYLYVGDIRKRLNKQQQIEYPAGDVDAAIKAARESWAKLASK